MNPDFSLSEWTKNWGTLNQKEKLLAGTDGKAGANIEHNLS